MGFQHARRCAGLRSPWRPRSARPRRRVPRSVPCPPVATDEESPGRGRFRAGGAHRPCSHPLCPGGRSDHRRCGGVSRRLGTALSEAWVVVVAVGGATILLKAIGPALLGGRALPEPVMGAVRLLAPAVLAALVVVQAIGGDREIVLDERLVGVGAALIAVVLRAPLLIVVAVAAAATALTRLALG